MKRSADEQQAPSASPATEPTTGSTLRATAPVFVPSQQPPQKMRRTEPPQHTDANATAFDEARRRAHEQAMREEEEYQAWRAAELADEGVPDEDEQAWLDEQMHQGDMDDIGQTLSAASVVQQPKESCARKEAEDAEESSSEKDG